jgi:hypothetical protein
MVALDFAVRRTAVGSTLRLIAPLLDRWPSTERLETATTQAALFHQKAHS